MKLSIQFLKPAVLLLVTALTFSSCVKKDYDDLETANVDPALTPTHTIRQLQAFATGPVGVEITSDVIIAGVVVADDSSGNIYKKLILQQDSSGISIQLDVSNFNTEYKVGRRIFVKCKGLFISNNEGNFELGISAADPVGRIPSGLVSKYLVKGKWGQYITPKVYTLDATNIPTNTLVTFNNVEFETPGVAWAAVSPSNLDIKDCAATPNTLVVYSSIYSTFALNKTPVGNGSITGIYTIYSGDGELQIRDLKDVNMTNLRCDGGTGNPNLTTVDSIRMLDPGAGNQIYLPADKKIEVTVTSDYSTNMLTGNGKNIYVQDGTAAILIFFNDPHAFAVGTKLEINVSGGKLNTYSGVLEIGNLPLERAIPIGTGSVTPRIVTIPDINANYNTWEGQLVKIENVTITGSGIYSGVNFLNDASSNSIELYTTSGASFSSDPYPTGVVSVTGILTEFNGTKEILIRNINDVQ
jgi:hypothetical protein